MKCISPQGRMAHDWSGGKHQHKNNTQLTDGLSTKNETLAKEINHIQKFLSILTTMLGANLRALLPITKVTTITVSLTLQAINGFQLVYFLA